MGYDLHIERMADGLDSVPTSIPLNEWCAAVAETEGVRLCSEKAHTFTNPATGEVISLGARRGDVEVFFAGTGEWHSVFRWRGRSAAFAARLGPIDASNPVWAAAVALATRLEAVIRGEEGEVYDLRTGERGDG